MEGSYLIRNTLQVLLNVFEMDDYNYLRPGESK